MNHKAIDAGATAFKKIDVPADWADAEDAPSRPSELKGSRSLSSRSRTSSSPSTAWTATSLPVSAFMDHVDGQFELGASAYEKRGVAVMRSRTGTQTKCIQCNQCAYVCPHATIRPFALTEEEAADAPEQLHSIDAMKAGKGKGVYKYAMAVSPLDCMGCGVCVKRLPEPAPLEMVPAESRARPAGRVATTCVKNVSEKPELRPRPSRAASSRSRCLEFSGSCAGCAETAYARLVTQLFGDRMYHLQRHRLLLHLGRPRCDLSVLHATSNGHGPGMG